MGACCGRATVSRPSRRQEAGYPSKCRGKRRTSSIRCDAPAISLSHCSPVSQACCDVLAVVEGKLVSVTDSGKQFSLGRASLSRRGAGEWWAPVGGLLLPVDDPGAGDGGAVSRKQPQFNGSAGARQRFGLGSWLPAYTSSRPSQVCGRAGLRPVNCKCAST
eukprot:scaffold158_cov388-Prasinococcus_capsulatus_cf.AAC.3